VSPRRLSGTASGLSYLYDRAGNLVGIENAEIMTEDNFPQTSECTTAGGFTGPASFSSTVVLFG
jgi:hypothetical protein